MSKPTCKIDGCERTRLARGWCSAHYERWRKDGDPGPAEIGYPGSRLSPPKRCAVRGCKRRQSANASEPLCREHAGLPPVETRTTCCIEGCKKPHVSHGLCVMHRYRVRRYGVPDGAQRAHGHGDDVSYIGMHARLRYKRGPARDYACVDCGGDARHWSYKYGDPDEKVSPRGTPYSTNMDYYEPRCSSCHRIYDLPHI